MNTEEIKEELSDIESIELPELEEIGFEYFDKKNNISTRLVGNKYPELSKTGRHIWEELKLLEKQFVHSIEISVEGYDHYPCEFYWSLGDIYTNEIYMADKPEDGVYRITVNAFIDRFSFRPHSLIFGLTTGLLKGIKIMGYLGTTIEEIQGTLSDTNASLEKLISPARVVIDAAEQKESERDALVTKIDDLNESLEETNELIVTAESDLEKSRTERTNVNAEATDLRNEITTLQARIVGQEESIEKNQFERKRIAEEVSDSSSELKKLENSIELFPSNLEGFVESSAEHKKLYWKLAAAPIAIIIVLAGMLIFNAAELTTVYNEEDNVRVFSILLTRMPYVIIAGGIITACYALAISLVSEIMRINSQTRGLSKMNIIATDVSAAAEEGLDLDQKELYHYRAGLKMDLLREHMKKEISEEYSYIETARVKKMLEGIKKGKITPDTTTPESSDNEPE